MTLAFGIPIGRATRVSAGQKLYSVLCFDTQKEIVKGALMRARARIPCSVVVDFHKDVKSIGTIPTSLIEEKVVEVAKTETTTAEGAAPAVGADGKPVAPAAGTATAPGAKAPAGGAAGAKAPAAAPAKPAGKK